VELRQLIPDDAVVDIADLLGGLELAARAHADRPYAIVNFITSADGRAAFQGRSAPLGDAADHEVFHGLREQVDAVFVGTRTLRIERYGRLVRDPKRRERRVEAGRSAEPLACLVTRSGDVPQDIPLFTEPKARVVVFGPPEVELSDHLADVEVVSLDPGELTLTTVMRRLRNDFGIRSLLCEGGPTVFSALLWEGLVDELFLTLAPKLTGGGMSPSLSAGPELPEIATLELVWALEHENSLFLRYARA
jgi:5-amino-6-(5-phosphoribosylamino)uracil reductase